jgi:4-hydroxy-tetrahydrodipicolinate reductase
MGQMLLGALSQDQGIQLVGAVDIKATAPELLLPGGRGAIPLETSVGAILNRAQPQVIVDFTVATATLPAVHAAAPHGIHFVIGTTGLSAPEIDEIGALARQHHIGAVVAANYALGAVLMMHMAKIAANYFDYAEIIELHHEKKIDAPSGTALTTARAMAQSRGKPFTHPPEPAPSFPSRGDNQTGITIHSVRLPGLVAHQEVIFGGLGETLTIRHDTINRECFMPGVILAVKEVTRREGLVYGLDALLGL